MFTTMKRVLALAVTATLALAGAACTSESDGGAANGKKITIGYMAWDEAIAASHLWQHILEEKGYQVQLKNLEAGLVYGGLASGDIDLFLDGWLPQTHASYMEKYGDKVEKLGVWYDKANLSIAGVDEVFSFIELPRP